VEQRRIGLDIMKKLFALLLFVSTFAFGQTYPSPTYNVLTLQTPLAVGSGGTGLNTVPTGDVLLGNGTGALTVSATLPATSGGTGTTTGLTPYAPTLATIAALGSATSATLPQSQVVIASYSTVGDAGGGVFNIGSTTTANGCTIFNDASGRSWYRQTSGNVTNVKWCGAKGDGATNDSTAFTNAVNIAKTIFVPDGTYFVTEGSIVLKAGQTLEGAGEASYAPGFVGAGTVINCTTNAGAACIQVTAGAFWVTIENLTVTRSAALGTLTSGSNGIQFNGISAFCNVQNVLVYNNYVGFLLRDTSSQSYMSTIVAQSNTSHGVELQNLASGSLQWVINNALSESNGGYGYLITSVNGSAAPISVSNMSAIFSFANTLGGFAVIGSATQPIFGPRLTNSFFGQDGNNELIFTGFGGDVQVTDSFFELAGTTVTGPNNTTPASNTGSGIEIDNGTRIKIANNVIDAMSVYGIYFAGGLNATVSGNTVTNSGQNTGTSGYGIFIASGAVADVTGNTSQNVGGGTTQKFGIANTGTITVLSGNNLSGNVTGGYTGNAPTDSCNAGTTCIFNQPNIVGVTNGSNAAAGSVGEVLTNQTGPTAFSTGTTAASTSENLTAGDWDVQCVAQLSPATGAIVTNAILGVNTTAAFGALGSYFQISATSAPSAAQVFESPVTRVSITTTTSYLCPLNVSFNTSTLTATGFIRARRVR
jgi:hypothetical protein